MTTFQKRGGGGIYEKWNKIPKTAKSSYYVDIKIHNAALSGQKPFQPQHFFRGNNNMQQMQANQKPLN